MPRRLWIVLIGMIINVTGGSFLWPLNTIYIHEELGKSLSIAGLILMFNSAASIFGNLTGGYLFDRFGGHKSIVFGAGITTTALIGLTFWHDFLSYAIFLIIIGYGSGVVNPAMFSLAGAAWKEGGRKTFNAMYVAQNVGVAVGTALAGYIASISFEFIFISNMVLYVVFFFIAFFFYKKISDNAVNPKAAVKNEPISKSAAEKRNLAALLIISVGYTLCWIAYVQWQTTIATYTQDINISLEQYSFLWTVNGALIVLGQPIIAWAMKLFKTLKHQIFVGLGIFIISFMFASISTDFTGFLTAMIILSLGEMFVWPAIPTIADQLAPKGKNGFYQGIINSAATGGRMVGPLLGGLIVDYFGMKILFGLLIVLFILAMFTTFLYDKVIKKQVDGEFESDCSLRI